MYDYDEMLKKELKNPEFRKEYQALEVEFEVAKQVIKLRVDKGMTQKEPAEKVHTSQSCIARLESGSYRNVSLSFLRGVGDALGRFRGFKRGTLHRMPDPTMADAICDRLVSTAYKLNLKGAQSMRGCKAKSHGI